MGIAKKAKQQLRGLAPEKGTTRKNLIAGLPGAISSVPDGMASSVLAGVNPVHGLYASIFGPIGGGLTSSTRLMVITTTSAAALAAGSAVAAVPADDRPRALFLLTMMAGALMVLAGIAKLGRYTRFVPHSVMIGFLSGVSANIIFGQLPDLVGAEASGPFALAKAWNLLMNLDGVDIAATIAGLSALAVLLAFQRTRVAAYSALIALVVPSLLVGLLHADSVPRVRDGGEIPSGLPMPALPHLADFSLSLLAGAFAVAALVLVQGAGVSEAAPNPDRTRSNPNQDFIAQGVGNLLAGLFRGMPVGGSVGQTALNVSAGAVGRWGAIFSGLWMALLLLLFSGLVGAVVMSTLAAVLIYAAVGSFRIGDIQAILRTGRISQIALIATFIATLFLPVAAAVGIGLVLSLLMQLNQEAIDLRVVELVPHDDGSFVERPAAPRLESRRVVLLDVYGSLFYAGARTLQARLPDPGRAENPAVVLRLRGRTMLGATAFAVLSDYAERLATAGGRLYLSGIDPLALQQLRSNQTVEQVTGVRIFEADETVGESSLQAYHAANDWLATQRRPEAR
ncbi:SulP family inorganic anion transporter [Amorphoplanes digitatis]|uniref:SulP family sulfate permease n=1 Tax=Actinoplanes digitatis TaxID=1868 RepID=A0A7W7I2B0_9ACTN|nr:SulP family inorganic anion transporter [Actinoplanes digitatis]MBB4765047.1 SulP family sulfate permease [Actinoplanes digitatis]GID98232.1 sodium-independent anion transporter [Actinoplanes digitatis]